MIPNLETSISILNNKVRFLSGSMYQKQKEFRIFETLFYVLNFAYLIIFKVARSSPFTNSMK
jgi:hypothetical protein